MTKHDWPSEAESARFPRQTIHIGMSFDKITEIYLW